VCVLQVLVSPIHSHVEILMAPEMPLKLQPEALMDRALYLLQKAETSSLALASCTLRRLHFIQLETAWSFSDRFPVRTSVEYKRSLVLYNSVYSVAIHKQSTTCASFKICNEVLVCVCLCMCVCVQKTSTNHQKSNTDWFVKIPQLFSSV